MMTQALRGRPQDLIQSRYLRITAGLADEIETYLDELQYKSNASSPLDGLRLFALVIVALLWSLPERQREAKMYALVASSSVVLRWHSPHSIQSSNRPIVQSFTHPLYHIFSHPLICAKRKQKGTKITVMIIIEMNFKSDADHLRELRPCWY